MDTYNLILDSDALKGFIDWLPELEPHEMYMVFLFARKKYAKECGFLSADKCQLKRFTSRKEHLFGKISQLETKFGTYTEKGNPIPNEALAVYITVNPRDLKAAMKQTAKKSLDAALDYNNENPHQLALTQIHNSCSNKHYIDFDFDGVEENDVLAQLEGNINMDAITLLKTTNGFHLLVNTKKIEQEHKKHWYQSIAGINGCDVRGDNLIPIPGTSQGGFIPYLKPI